MNQRTWLLGLVALLGLGLWAGCGSKVSKENFDKIQTGMTVEEVQDILGEGQNASAGVSVAGLSVTGDVYEWSHEGTAIRVVFKDGKVVEKLFVDAPLKSRRNEKAGRFVNAKKRVTSPKRSSQRVLGSSEGGVFVENETRNTE